jgi:hypothetical protein
MEEQKLKVDKLGRWAWPENPDYLVYPLRFNHSKHQVLRQSTGEVTEHDGRAGRAAPYNYVDASRAVVAFYDAVQGSQPWHQAVATQTWMIKAQIPGIDRRVVELAAFAIGDAAFVYGDGSRIWHRDVIDGRLLFDPYARTAAAA